MRITKNKALLTVCIVALLLGGLLTYGQMDLLPVPIDEVRISAYSGANGNIVLQAFSQDGTPIHLVGHTAQDDAVSGSFIVLPRRSMVDALQPASRQNPYYAVLNIDLATLSERRAADADTARDFTISAVYFGSQGNSTLLWEDGMSLPPVPFAY